MQVCRRCGERNPDRARFCMSCALLLDESERPGETRKVVTVLFADLRGSTAIGERLDPEAVRMVLTRFYDAAREVIERHGGTVEKFIGDAVMAVFGVPLVHEDDAMRGVRAAAELQQVLGRMNDELLRDRYGVGLELRIGVNTGEVVAGDPSTGSSFVAGDTVNVGARLEQAAPPGGVLIGAETRMSVGNVVEVEPTEPLELKGKAAKVQAFRLVELREQRAEPALPLVGRDTERRTLDDALDSALRDERAVAVTLAGPPGIGKTRLAEDALDRWVRERDAFAVRIRCVAEGEGDPAGPLVGLVVGLLDLPADPGASEVERAIAGHMADNERAPIVAAVLTRLVRGGTGPLPIADVAWAIGELVGRTTRDRPVAILVDDAHSGDVDLEAVVREILRPSGASVVVVRTVLPEFAEPAAGAATGTGEPGRFLTIDVEPLEPSFARQLLAPLVGEGAVNDRIVERAGGNPLFLIETARMLGEGSTSSADGDELPVPGTIRGLLAARIERLPPSEARLLEVASAIGQGFPLEGAASIGRLSLEDVHRSIASLQARHLVAGVGSLRGENASFAHVLVRDVAYESMTKERRAELHHAYASWLEARGRVIPTVVAHHLEQAYRLRCSLGVPGADERRLAARAASAFARGGLRAAPGASRVAAVSILERAVPLLREASAGGERTDALEDARCQVGRLADELGEWPVAIEALNPVVELEPDGDDAVYLLGVALLQAHRGQADDPELRRGRSLLEGLLARAPSADVAASLAGSWKGIDDERALALYRQAFELDPGAPYALGNVVEMEAAEAGELRGLGALQTSLAAAAHRCRAQIDAGENLPWACFDLAKFSLLAGEPDEAFAAACLAVARSTARFMIETSLQSLEGFERLDPNLSGLGRVIWLYRLGLAIGFEVPEAVASVAPLATPDAEPFSRPVVIVAGGSSLEAEAEVRWYGPLIREAMHGGGGTLVSGATRQGVSVIAGDVADENPGFHAIGYLPSVVPGDVEVDADPDRYAELRRTSGVDFSVAEPLQYWGDVVASGVPVTDVRLVAIGGGRVSSAEYRMALALGAGVGAIRGSGGAASALLQDPRWATIPRLVEVAPQADALRQFLGTRAG